jgi:hypothetical protein
MSLRWRLARSLITVCWFRFLNRLDLSLKRVKPCDCARNADQIECLFGPLNLSFDGRSLSRPSPDSFKLQDPGPNRPADVGATAECKQQRQGRVHHGRTPAPASHHSHNAMEPVWFRLPFGSASVGVTASESN